MSEKSAEFDLYLPATKETDEAEKTAHSSGLRKFTARLLPGNTRYDVRHNFGTPHVIVQTRIAGNIREGGISILDENTVRVSFGGTLNEPMDVVIIG
jgi:hypothetical protein